MIGLLGVLGGAAAIEFSKLRRRDKKEDVEQIRRRERDLKALVDVSLAKPVTPRLLRVVWAQRRRPNVAAAQRRTSFTPIPRNQPENACQPA
jgi:hypothetical protein